MGKDDENAIAEELEEFVKGPEESNEPPAEPPEPPAEPPETPPVEPGDPPVEPPVEPPSLPEVTPPPAEPPAEPTPPAEPDWVGEPLTEREKVLLKRVEDLSGGSMTVDEALRPDLAGQPPATPPSGPIQPTPGAAPPVIPEVLPPNFLEGVDWTQGVDDPAVVTEVLNKVYAKAMEDASLRASENILRSIPQLIVNYTTRQAAMSNLVQEFYTNNPDLVDVKRTVAMVANEIAAENPDWQVGDVFKESASRTRRILGLGEQVRPPVPPAGENTAVPRKPGLPPGTGSRSATPGASKTSLEKEVEDLILD